MEFDNLYIWTSNTELIEAYTKHIINHNKQITPFSLKNGTLQCV